MLALGLNANRWKIFATVAVALVLLRAYPSDDGRVETVRSFFGVHKIVVTPNGQYHVLMHGTTIHGAEKFKNDDGTPVTGRPEPITYYHKDGGIGQAITAIRERKGAPLRVAVIGLGSGTLACASEPGEDWKFFEIDQSMVDTARDPKYFTYIQVCEPNLKPVIGDARLTFAREPDGVYDLIIVDAYSSDAIPIHLATEEAMEIYKAKLAPQGAVVMHVSNRHLELSSVVVGIADANDMKSWVYSEDSGRDNEYIFSTSVVVSAREEADVGKLASSDKWALDRGRGSPAGLDRRLFQRAGRGVAAAQERRGIDGELRSSKAAAYDCSVPQPMEFVMANFTPISAAIGGALIGLSAVLLLLLDRPDRRHQRYLRRPADPARRGQGLAHRLHRRAHSGAHPRRPDRLRHGAAQMPASWTVIVAAGAPGRLRHPAGRRLHLRARHLRHRAAVAALDRRHHRLHGDRGRHRRGHPSRVGRLSHVDHRSLVVRPHLRRGPADLRHGQPTKVLGFLDIFGAWDPSLAVVMAAALAVSVPGFMLADRRARPLLAAQYFWPSKRDRPAAGRWAPPCSASVGALSGYARGRRWRPGDAVAGGHRLRRRHGGRDDRSRPLAAVAADGATREPACARQTAEIAVTVDPAASDKPTPPTIISSPRPDQAAAVETASSGRSRPHPHRGTPAP